MVEVPTGELYLGERIDGHERTGEPVLLKASSLTTHGVIVGMTGSGKTGLGIALLEEALLQGVPTLILDPKGDLGNLLLTFPGLDAASFAPWVEGADPAEVATTWKEGLASWGIDGARIQALRDAATFTIYTPGSTSGVGLNVVGSLQRPPEGTDDETIVDEVQGFVSGLLGLVGIAADPLASREHILLANLVQQAWAQGQDLDLAGLVAQVQRPPLRKLGVFELDEFFPPGDRTKLALQLNGLLASPAFAAWGKGDPLDIGALLEPGGTPGCAIISLAHLSDEERQFVVTLVLSKLVTWMRRQPGTDRLRALVYFDEVMGFVPPTAAPPAKAPILTILKQARAFGVGLVLATQNPVDVDYKALSNAGTWMIGRLQTEQDKARLLDGLSAAAGGVDTKAMSDTIAGLDKREFVLRQAGQDAPLTFASRWAMSYLRGPLTREQIAGLMEGRRTRPADAPTPPVATAAADATPVMPTVADGLTVRWLDPAAPWATQIGAVPTSTTYAAALVATADLLFDDTKADLRQSERVECVLHPIGEPLDVESLITVDHDARDLRSEPPEGTTYRIPDAPIGERSFATDASKAIADHLLATRTIALASNRALKLVSRPGETAQAFAARCDAAADVEADKRAAVMAKRYEARVQRARAALATAADRVEQAEEVQNSRRSDELLSDAGDVLGSIFGGRRSARSIAGKVGGIARRRGRSSEADRRADAAANRVSEKQEALADLEADMAEELAAIADEWDAKASAIETIEVGLEKSDVRVTDIALVWVPVA
jgi:Helicase HerA, central domain